MDESAPKPTRESRIIQAGIDACGMTKAAIAERLGVSAGMVSQWVTGRRPLAINHAQALAALIGEQPERISVAYREALAATGQANGPSIMDDPEEAELDPALEIARLRNDIHALNLALGAVVAVMVQHRPVEAQDVAGVLRRQVPARFRDKGLIHELLTALERSRA